MRKKVKSCLLGEVEYKVSWDIRMSLIYYMVIQKGKIYIILSYQAGFLKRIPKFVLLKGPSFDIVRLSRKKAKEWKRLSWLQVRFSQIVGRLQCG